MKQNLQAKVAEIEKIITSLGAALKIQQFATKKLYDLDVLNRLSKVEMGMSGVLTDLLYKLQAVSEKFNLDEINARADELKAKAFDSASDAEDTKTGFHPVEQVSSENNIVILTSSTESENDEGFFRSRIVINDVSIPDMREKLLQAKVGDKFSTVINGVQHNVTILGIREKDASEPVDTSIPAAEEVK